MYLYILTDDAFLKLWILSFTSTQILPKNFTHGSCSDFVIFRPDKRQAKWLLATALKDLKVDGQQKNIYPIAQRLPKATATHEFYRIMVEKQLLTSCSGWRGYIMIWNMEI